MHKHRDGVLLDAVNGRDEFYRFTNGNRVVGRSMRRSPFSSWFNHRQKHALECGSTGRARQTMHQRENSIAQFVFYIKFAMPFYDFTDSQASNLVTANPVSSIGEKCKWC